MVATGGEISESAGGRPAPPAGCRGRGGRA
eukprot:COSAG02_NODE_1835_length_10714_cov_7.585437_14_plen_29_part_01